VHILCCAVEFTCSFYAKYVLFVAEVDKAFSKAELPKRKNTKWKNISWVFLCLFLHYLEFSCAADKLRFQF